MNLKEINMDCEAQNVHSVALEIVNKSQTEFG